ncbi:MAG: fold5, partial [Clostridiaceae bacterium]|nr:fold5 [Clostridiaceae bacterium]
MVAVIITFALMLIVISVIGLDITKKLNLLHKGFMYLYFIFSPHIVLLGYLFSERTQFGQDNYICKWIILTEMIIFILYLWMKVNIAPHTKKQIVNLRLRVMLG